MEDFVKRMVKEYYDLREKKDKLNAFILGNNFKCLSEEEQCDLDEQYHVMSAYASVLSRRLKRQGFDVLCHEKDECCCCEHD